VAVYRTTAQAVHVRQRPPNILHWPSSNCLSLPPYAQYQWKISAQSCLRDNLRLTGLPQCAIMDNTDLTDPRSHRFKWPAFFRVFQSLGPDSAPTIPHVRVADVVCYDPITLSPVLFPDSSCSKRYLRRGSDSNSEVLTHSLVLVPCQTENKESLAYTAYRNM
jgi:hypothetical protein